MYISDQIKHIHFEPTQRCQAQCPMCDRTNNRHIKNAELSLNNFMSMVDIDFVHQLNSLLMCGNHGDPIVSNDTLSIFRYLRVNNPKMYLHMTTNAGARDDDWWKELVSIFGSRGKVTFSVDGLEDTNHLYRVNVNWKRVEHAMDVFTQAGGKGLWVYLIFEHNEHQVEEAERMAKLFGLEFVRKKTGRWVQSYKGKKVDKKITTKGNEIKPPTNPENQNKSVNSYDKLIKSHGSFQEYLDQTKITCKSLDNNEIYISAEGLVTPCCWTAGRFYKAYEEIGDNQIWSYFEDLKDINALHTPLRDIIDGGFFKKLQKSWNISSCADGKSKVCAEKCGSGFDAFRDQWK
jgi:MoaA/NifB/PqqE/SkfB family radical SAM enzyme